MPHCKQKQGVDSGSPLVPPQCTRLGVGCLVSESEANSWVSNDAVPRVDFRVWRRHGEEIGF